MAPVPPPPPPPAPATSFGGAAPVAIGASMPAPEDSGRSDDMSRKIKRLEQQLSELSEDYKQAEMRTNRAEEKVRAMQDRSDKNEEALRSSIDQVRRDVTSRQEQMQTSLSDVQKKQYEDGSVLRLVKMEQAQNSQDTSRLQDDLRKESTARAALEATARSSADTAEHALRIAEEARDVSQSVADSIKNRLEDLETKVSKTSIEALKKLSVPDRIMYFQNAHRHSSGIQTQSILKDKNVDAEISTAFSGKAQTVPLLRCVA